jgi:hypothetical protein
MCTRLHQYNGGLQGTVNNTRYGYRGIGQNIGWGHTAEEAVQMLYDNEKPSKGGHYKVRFNRIAAAGLLCFQPWGLSVSLSVMQNITNCDFKETGVRVLPVQSGDPRYGTGWKIYLQDFVWR